jgi:hypothetical protein
MHAPNDEPDLYNDDLDQRKLVCSVGELLRNCEAPYVLGIGGPWGAGKTSFMLKLHAYLGGEFMDRAADNDPTSQQLAQEKRRREWFNNQCLKNFNKPYEPPPPPEQDDGYHILWFNPWQHQFEQLPQVALLHEIRNHLSLHHKALSQLQRGGAVALEALLNSLSDLSKVFTHAHLPSFNIDLKKSRDRLKEYDNDHLIMPLSSEKFRKIFEQVLEAIIGPGGRMVIFIDDLDRCVGETAFKLLEALKLYLNVKNCVFVLGTDRGHLEQAIAPRIGGDLWQAREYLNKLFTGQFLLPSPRRIDAYVQRLMHFDDPKMQSVWLSYGLSDSTSQDSVVYALNDSLPHNPRKIKAFISSWRLYLQVLAWERPGVTLRWQLVFILHYLAQFEEPIYRRIEENPSLYSQGLLPFCQGKTLQSGADDGLFKGLSLPGGALVENEWGERPGVALAPRILWVSELVQEVGRLDREEVYQHMVQLGRAI